MHNKSPLVVQQVEQEADTSSSEDLIKQEIGAGKAWTCVNHLNCQLQGFNLSDPESEVPGPCQTRGQGVKFHICVRSEYSMAMYRLYS